MMCVNTTIHYSVIITSIVLRLLRLHYFMFMHHINLWISFVYLELYNMVLLVLSIHFPSHEIVF